MAPKSAAAKLAEKQAKALADAEAKLKAQSEALTLLCEQIAAANAHTADEPSQTNKCGIVS